MNTIPIFSNNPVKESGEAAKRANSLLDRLASAPLRQADIDKLTGVYHDTKAARIKAERGIVHTPLEVELLLKRIAQGGHSGKFLADAFISAYRIGQPFNRSLGELIRLDTEAFRLFHQILHIRHVSSWSDDVLYEIEQRIKAEKNIQLLSR
ncbi:hypothetical protein [Methylobacter luteus]|uniref:hypothetical protein n=1 Tax=Methylobacter luteus TaxID=415 RepID=UPI000484A410|nr:hypothetical protein [Methylobacter luteus]